jgi:hypothetical protein
VLALEEDRMNIRINEITINESRQPTFQAFDELKTLREWQTDPRCVVDKSTLEKRLFRGWDLREALSTPKGDLSTLGFDVKVPAFGEERTLEEWGADVRRHVPLSVIRTRLENGWTPEKAIATPAFESSNESGKLKVVEGDQKDRPSKPAHLAKAS